MKSFVRSLLALVLTSALTLTHAAEKDPFAWTPAQKYLGAATLALIAIDWGQTRYIARNTDRYYERNPLIGRKPDLGDVNYHFVASIALVAAVAHFIPEWRTGFLSGVAAGQLGVVINNRSIGIQVRF